MLKIVISLIIGAIIGALLLFAYDVYSGNIKQGNFNNVSFSGQMMPPNGFGSGEMMGSGTMMGGTGTMMGGTGTMMGRGARPDMTESEQIEMISKRTGISKDIIKMELDSGKTMREIMEENTKSSTDSSKANSSL
ncbi:hypothetical protein HGA92_03485 [Candidatus Gracilibacteria bacterium]|nr:hypothetical protein [Candidatus Gracilibacteria bacterium]NUJ99160.1 hypothetical protein [Candidatus Gracilibacteria bacterium]